MKKLVQEFKKFISRGNVMDLAVGVIIGGAFTAIVTSLVNDIIMPVITLFTSNGFESWIIPLRGDVTLNIGSFIGAIISFLIISIVVFIMVKIINKLHKKEEVKPTLCPYCKSAVNKEATRCPHCTSQIVQP